MSSLLEDLPLLPTMGVGSYAGPGWFIAANRQVRAGDFGPHDVAELFEDAIRIVVADQLDAGVDILSDGELSRQRFIFEIIGRVRGIERRPPARRLGITGYDMAPHYEAVDTVHAPDGLGLVEEYRFLKRLVPDKPVKMALPGPLTFGLSLTAGARKPDNIVDELIAMVRGELIALTDAGADYVQLDEPSLPDPPFGLSLADTSDVINRTLAGVAGRRAVHVCFGNNAGRPMADRRLSRLIDALGGLACEQLLLEFSNQGMVDVPLLPPLAEKFDIAAGVIDVKNFYLETADDVARRIDQCLEVVPEARLGITADCGFSALPRYVARQKLAAMVAGAKLVRGRL